MIRDCHNRQSLILKTATMKRKEVESSIIESIGYNEEKKIMQVMFIRGDIAYNYYNISIDEYNSIMNSQSIGSRLKEVVVGKRYNKDE